MTINASNGLITWIPTAAPAGNQDVSVRVVDPGGLAATQSFIINVSGGTALSTTRVDLASPSSYTAARGTVVNITLNWYRRPVATNHLQFMHLQNAAGTIWSVDDHVDHVGELDCGPLQRDPRDHGACRYCLGRLCHWRGLVLR